MAKYDSGILQDYADSLYRKAAWITFKCSTLGAITGVVIALILVYGVRAPNAESWGTPALVIFGIIGALIGFAIGQRRAFQYRLQAQTVLCQMQIEYNTRQKPRPEQETPRSQNEAG